MNRREFLLATLAGMLSANGAAGAADSASTRPVTSEFLTEIPPTDGSILLARPTDRSVALSLLHRTESEVLIVYSQDRTPMTGRTRTLLLKAGEPAVTTLEGLSPNTGYEYAVVMAKTGRPLFPGPSLGRFHTCRPPGAAFTFTIQADSHLDDGCRADIYQQTLENQLADRPDFMIDMGDTSMAGKHPSRESAVKQYLAQRYYFGLIGHSIPSFLVVGNHDGEEIKRAGAGNPDGFAVWSNRQRKRFFANPVPDRFYTGNTQPHPAAGLLQNYYAWTWGDALFVVLDPYWTSTASRGDSAGWHMSLGKAQYEWLAATLAKSNARHKLVFIHQLVGGLDDAGRGGIEAASNFEWGGCELDGRPTFKKNRPGWMMPIHQLLVENRVSVVFHGHDHFFADQRKDGIVYLLVPQAAHRNFRSNHAKEYGYTRGRFMPNSGHLRVQVMPTALRIEYVQAAPPSMTGQQLRNGQVVATAEL